MVYPFLNYAKFNLDKKYRQKSNQKRGKIRWKLTTLPAHQSLDISKEIH